MTSFIVVANCRWDVRSFADCYLQCK